MAFQQNDAQRQGERLGPEYAEQGPAALGRAFDSSKIVKALGVARVCFEMLCPFGLDHITEGVEGIPGQRNGRYLDFLHGAMFPLMRLGTLARRRSARQAWLASTAGWLCWQSYANPSPQSIPCLWPTTGNLLQIWAECATVLSGKVLASRCLSVEFPTQRNREFSDQNRDFSTP